MSFREEKVEDFIGIFEAAKEQIAAFPGCEGLKLLRDAHKRNVFFTYSFWNSEHELDQYRHSELFKTTWEGTKALFDDKPQAWSTILADNVK